MKMLRVLLGLLAVTVMAQAPPHSVTLTWNWTQGTGAAATGFNVKRSATSGTEVTIGTTTMPTMTYVDPFQLTDEGKTFFYIVTATGPGGESLPSSEVSATIPFRVPSSPTGLSSRVQ